MNCLLVGHERFSRPNGQVVHGLRARLGRWRITIHQVGRSIGTPVPEYQDRCVDTTEIIVDGVSHSTKASAERVIDDVCSLLSLAGSSQVCVRAYSFEGNSHSHSIIARGNFFRPTIEIHGGEIVRQYLEGCWPSFRLLKRTRQLPAVINYLVAADLHHTVQIKLLLVFTALECLKATYARAAGIPFYKGRFRKPTKGNPKKAHSYGLEELLRMMLQDVGIRRGLKRALRLRNAIVHTGLSGHDTRQLSAWYDWCYSLLQEYLLHLLEYHGPYYDYTTGDERWCGRQRPSSAFVPP